MRLNGIKKRITIERIRHTIKMCKDRGIMTLRFFLIGNPGETEKMMYENVTFAQSLGLDYVQFSKVLAKPGTLLWKEMIERTGCDYWREWICGNVEDKPLPRHWTDLSNEDIDRIARNCYVKFSLRPWYLLKQTLKCRFLFEFRRKLKVFLDMIFSQEKVSASDEKFYAFNNTTHEQRKQTMEWLWGKNFAYLKMEKIPHPLKPVILK